MSYPLIDALSSVLAEVSVCLETTTNGVPSTVSMYHGPPPDDCGDSLFVWVDEVRGTTSFPEALSGTYRCAAVTGMVRVKLRVTRNCWPVLKDNARMPFPPVTETYAATAKLIEDVEAVWCCLSNGFADGSIWAGDNPLTPEAVLVGVAPKRPKGGLAYVEAEMLIELA